MAGLQPLEWVALYLLSFILAFPYLVEFLRIYLLLGPRYKAAADAEKSDEGETVRTWDEYIVYSRRWYTFVQSRVWIAPPLWGFPLAWVLVTATYTASTFLTWNNPQALDGGYYNAILAILFPHVLLTLTWIPSFFRMRSHSWALGTSLTISVLAIVSFTLQGVGHVGPAFYLYIPFLLWWLYLTWISAEVWRDARRHRRDDYSFDDVYDPSINIYFSEVERDRVTNPHGWELVQDPSMTAHSTKRI